MTDSLVPDWIKKIKQQEDQEAARAEADALRSALAGRAVQMDGPSFWKQLIKELQITVDNLPLIGLTGTVSSVGSAAEEGYQIAVSRPTVFPAMTYTNVFYKPGGPIVRLHPLDESSSNLIFGIADDKVSLWSGASAMTPEKAAEFIVEPMAVRLKQQR